MLRVQHYTTAYVQLKFGADHFLFQSAVAITKSLIFMSSEDYVKLMSFFRLWILIQLTIIIRA